ncbi:MAG: LytR family transcriptional regulator [Acidimicrobiia bacterium]|nr:LytR family transcriptional regulator [Acidimicrobiia bacterium]MYL10061.1 LytR family transcriptional regulator [Acidimicrobiia bacterium]
MGDSAPGAEGAAPKGSLPRWWRWGWPLLLLVLAAAVPLLVWLGWSAISGSSDGTVVGDPNDPAAPGYEAFVDPTPTLLLVHANGDRLHGVTLLVLTDEGTEGAVLFIPPETMTSNGLLSDRWAESGSTGVADSVAELLGVRPGETQVVDDAGWAALVSAVAPVDLMSAVPLLGPDGETLHGAGLVTLAPADVGPYLAGRSPAESPLEALTRHLSFWTGWLVKVEESAAPDVIPGETDRGMGRFGRALAEGESLLSTIVGQVDDSGSVVLNPEFVRRQVNEIIPFPISAVDGSLPKVRLLNGVGDLELTKAAARELSRAGAHITRIGNAAEFGWETTKVAYHDTGFAPHAEAFRDALGTGTVIAEELPDISFDITVTFGADFSQLMTGDG